MTPARVIAKFFAKITDFEQNLNVLSLKTKIKVLEFVLLQLLDIFFNTGKTTHFSPSIS